MRGNLCWIPLALALHAPGGPAHADQPLDRAAFDRWLAASGVARADPQVLPSEVLLRELANSSTAAWRANDPADPLADGVAARILDAILLPEGVDAPPDEIRRLAEFWIGRLNEEVFAIREEASHRLVDLGPGATPSLKIAAAGHPDPETRNRARLAIADLRDRPVLADLDYSRVHESLTKLVKQNRNHAAVENFLAAALSRLGPATVHQQEVWLLQPFFAGMIAAESPDAARLTAQALASEHPNLAESVATTIARVTARYGISPIYLAALENRRIEVISRLLDHAPTLPEISPHREPLATALHSLFVWPDLPQPDRQKVHRIRLISLHQTDSLDALLAAADETPAVLAEALGDPRLLGLPPVDPAPVTELIDHSSAKLRSAAGFFLLTRADARSQRAALPFLSHLDRDSMSQLSGHFDAADTSFLKPALQEIAIDRSPGWENAALLLAAMPEIEFGKPENPLFKLR